MANDGVDLGGRLPLLEPHTLRGEQRALYDRMQDTLVAWAAENGFQSQTAEGALIGPFNPFLHSVGITPGFLAWMQADAERTTLTKRVHEVVILTVGAIWDSPYEIYAHSAVARTVGLPEQAIEALATGGSSEQLSHDEQLAHRFARALTLHRRVDDELYHEAETTFGQVGLVDMVYLVGMYLLTCALLNAFEVPAPR